MPEESTEILAVVREELGFAWNIVRCASYVLWWRAKRSLWSDQRLIRGAKIGAAISGTVLLLDLVLFFLHKELVVWLGGAAVVMLVPTALFLAFHRFEEALHKQNEASFAGRVGPVVDALSDLARATIEAKQAELDRFVARLLQNIYEDFKERIPANLSVMFPGADGKLRITYLYPPGTEYDPEICFSPGEGAAGYCYKEAKIVYVPAIKFMHGILIRIPDFVATDHPLVEYGLKRRIYVPVSEKYEIYESILCLPVSSPNLIHAVLSIDSKRSDAFGSHDIHVLRAYARILGDGISLFHN